MKKHLQLMMLTLLCLIMGATGAKAETESYTFTSKFWEAKDGKGVAANWTEGKEGAGFSNGGIQVTTKATGANGTSPKSFTNITKVTVTYCTNASKGVGKIAVKVGNGTAKQLDVTTTGGTTARTLDFNFSPAETGAVNIAVTCTTNSIYVIGAEITYSDPNYVAPVTFSPEEGTRLTVGDKITLTSEGNTIYYTTDGSAAADATLNGASPLEVTITDAMAANKQLTVNARAYNSTKNNYSDATSVSYSVVPAGTVFMESFSNTDGSGGNDDNYTGSIGSSDIEADETWADGTFENCGGADNCLKFGTGSKNGTFETGTIALNGNGTLTFRAAGWGNGSNTLKVTATGGTITGNTDITLTNGEWKDYTVNITGAEGELVLSFSGKRGFIDDIMVAKAADPCDLIAAATTSAETFYYDEYWQRTDVTTEVTDNGYTFTLPEATDGRFKSLFNLQTDIATDKNELYDFSADVYVNKPIDVYWSLEAASGVLISDETKNLIAETVNSIEAKGIPGKDLQDLRFILDLGGNDADLEVSVRNVVLKARSCVNNNDVIPELELSVGDIEAEQATLLMKGIDDNAEEFTYFVSVNGKKEIAVKPGNKEQVSYQLTGLIQDSENTVAVRVSNGTMVSDPQTVTFTTLPVKPYDYDSDCNLLKDVTKEITLWTNGMGDSETLTENDGAYDFTLHNAGAQAYDNVFMAFTNEVTMNADTYYDFSATVYADKAITFMVDFGELQQKTMEIPANKNYVVRIDNFKGKDLTQIVLMAHFFNAAETKVRISNMVLKEHDCVSTELEVEEITTDGVAKLTGKWDADKFQALDAETGANAYDFTDVSDLPTTFNNQNMAKNPNTMFISPVPGTFLFNELVKKDQGGYQGYNIQIIDHFNNTEDHSVNTAVAPITVVSPFFQRVFSAANVWATAVFPWIQDNMPGNIQIYGLSDVKTENGVTTLTFEEVVTAAPEAGKPYLVHADGADITMAGGGDQTITWETTPVEMGGVTFTPTFVKMAQADNQYALSGTPQGGTPSFGKNTEFDVPAFRSVITKDGNEAKLAVMFNDATGIHKATAEQLSAVFNIYSIDGKIVKRNASSMFSLAPGAYIVNGKKVIVK